MTESSVEQADGPADTTVAMPDFTFDGVDHAYTPSGRTTVLAVIAMAIAVAVLSPIAGALMYGLDRIVGAVLNFMYQAGELAGLLALIAGLAAYVMGGFGIGIVLARTVDFAGYHGKNRNVVLSIAMALVAGALTILFFYRVRVSELDATAFNSFLDWLKLSLYAAGTLAAAFTAGSRVREEAFCESCGIYMNPRDLFSVPASHEEKLHMLLDRGKFEDLVEVPIELDTDRSRSTVHLDYCLQCLQNGYLSCTTEHVRSTTDDDGNQQFVRRNQRIFSKAVNQTEITSLSAAYQEANREDREVPPEPPMQPRPVAASAEAAPSADATAADPSQPVQCWTCDERLAVATSVVPMTCPEGKGHAGRIDELRESGYLRDKTIFVPRCRECFDAEKRNAWAGQIAAWTGLPLGVAAGIAVGGPTESGWLGFFAGLVTFIVVAVGVMWFSRRSVVEGTNARLAADFPPVKAATEAEWVVGSRLIPVEGIDPRLLRPWEEVVPTPEPV